MLPTCLLLLVLIFLALSAHMVLDAIPAWGQAPSSGRRSFGRHPTSSPDRSGAFVWRSGLVHTARVSRLTTRMISYFAAATTVIDHAMSALPPKADTQASPINVRSAPIADICLVIRSPRRRGQGK